MTNCTEVFRNSAVKSVSEFMNPEKLSEEKGIKADLRRDWGNDDYKAIVRRNMDEGVKKHIGGTE